MTDTRQRVAPAPGPVAPSWTAYLRAHPGPATLGMLSFGAAAIHFAVSPDHFGEWAPYGIAFACLAWFQILWAAAYVARPSPGWARAAVVVNAAVILVWAWSRTIGLPIGPEPGSTEPVGFADTLSSGLEARLVRGLVLVGSPIGDRIARQPARWAGVVGAATLLVVSATLIAMAALAPQAMPMG